MPPRVTGPRSISDPPANLLDSRIDLGQSEVRSERETRKGVTNGELEALDLNERRGRGRCNPAKGQGNGASALLARWPGDREQRPEGGDEVPLAVRIPCSAARRSGSEPTKTMGAAVIDRHGSAVPFTVRERE